VAYSDEVKISALGVDPELIARHGAVSGEVAAALADGVRSRLGSDLGVGITGVAGPGGGTAAKPVGLVWLSVAGRDREARVTRSVSLPGTRADVRERATTVAMHLIRRLLVDLGGDAERGALESAQEGDAGQSAAPIRSDGAEGQAAGIRAGTQ
jgi:nicotinamide-nucleotide amidase